jgi:hypothetical protein
MNKKDIIEFVNNNGLYKFYNLLKRMNKIDQENALDIIHDNFAYWIYEDCCEALGYCG